MSILSYIFSCRGRIGRKRYTISLLLFFLLTFLLAKLTASNSSQVEQVFSSQHYSSNPLFIILVFFNFSAIVRRLHDINQSGWWIGIFVLMHTTLAWAQLSMFLLYLQGLQLIVLCVLAVIKGTDGANNYGEQLQ